jgi:hypothetical protein
MVSTSGPSWSSRAQLSRPRGYSIRVAAILQTACARRVEGQKPRSRGARDVSLQALHTTVRFHDTRKRELEWYAPNFGVSTHNPIPGRPVPLQASFQMLVHYRANTEPTFRITTLYRLRWWCRMGSYTYLIKGRVPLSFVDRTVRMVGGESRKSRRRLASTEYKSLSHSRRDSS